MKYKYQIKDARKFSWDGLKGWAYNDKEEFPNASAAYFEVTGSHGKIRTTKSDRVYYVIDGRGEFDVGGEVIPVSKGDVVIVPVRVDYDYKAVEGVLKLFLVHTPAFDENHEERIDG